MAKINQILRKSAVSCLKIYQLIVSPLLGPHCRFHPSCSQYAIAVVQNHGIIAGAFFTIKRLLKCHPWHPGGFDPPPNEERT